MAKYRTNNRAIWSHCRTTPKFDFLHLESGTALNIKFADLETKLVTEFGLESNKTKNVSYDKCEFIELKNILKARNIKLLRHKNNISIADEHLDNKTAPKSIHIKHFPRSAFEHNATHVKAYDKILKALQVTLLKLNKETLS